MKKLREIFDLSPPKLSFCVAFLFFAVLFSSLSTYAVVAYIDEYDDTKNILQNGQLVEAEFVEVGRQIHQTGYNDGDSYYAIYVYVDENGNSYKTETARAFRSEDAVLKYVETNSTKSIYIDGKGHSLDGDETLTKHIVKGMAAVIVMLLFYAMVVAITIQMVRRIKLNREEMRASES